MTSLIKALRRSSLKHKKLGEEWGGDNSRDLVLEGVTFFVKYIGCSLVEEAKGVRTTALSIKAIVAVSKNKVKKLDRVSVTVSPSGVRVENLLSHETVLEVPIYRISYCSADASYDHVFAFVSANEEGSDAFQCHAFLCPKKKIAHAVTLTIAQAFKLAFESWQNAELQRRLGAQTNGQLDSDTDHSHPLRTLALHHPSQMLLIDLGEDNVFPSSTQLEHLAPWEDFDSEVSFEKFIQTRFESGTALSPNAVSELQHFIESSGRHFEMDHEDKSDLDQFSL